jgi:hypothetical protein
MTIRDLEYFIKMPPERLEAVEKTRVRYKVEKVFPDTSFLTKQAQEEPKDDK